MGSAPSKRAEKIPHADIDDAIRNILVERGAARVPSCAVSDVVQELERRHAKTDFSKRIAALGEALKRHKQRYFGCRYTPVDDFPVEPPLGFDAAGRVNVFYAREHATGEVRKVRQASRDHPGAVRMLRTEHAAGRALMGQARADGVFERPVAFFDTAGDPDVYLVLVAPPAPGVPLLKAIAALGASYNEAVVVKVVRSLVAALGHLHQARRVVGVLLPEALHAVDGGRLLHKIRVEALALADYPPVPVSVARPLAAPSAATSPMSAPSTPPTRHLRRHSTLSGRSRQQRKGSRDSQDLYSLAQEVMACVQDDAFDAFLADTLRSWGPLGGVPQALDEGTDIQSLGRLVLFLCTGRCCAPDAREEDLFAAGEWEAVLGPPAREFITRCLFPPRFTSVVDALESAWLMARGVDLSLLPLDAAAARIEDYVNGMPHMIFTQGDAFDSTPSPTYGGDACADITHVSSTDLAIAREATAASDMIPMPKATSDFCLSRTGSASDRPMTPPPGWTPFPGSTTTGSAEQQVSQTASQASLRQASSREREAPPLSRVQSTAASAAAPSSGDLRGVRGGAAAGSHPVRLEDFLRKVDVPPAVQELLVRIEKERVRGDGVLRGDDVELSFSDGPAGGAEGARVAEDEAADRAALLAEYTEHALTCEQVLETLDRCVCVETEQRMRAVLVLTGDHYLNPRPAEGGVAVLGVHREALWLELTAWLASEFGDVHAWDGAWGLSEEVAAKVAGCAARCRRVVCEREVAQRAVLTAGFSRRLKDLRLPQIRAARVTKREAYCRGEVAAEEDYKRRQHERAWADARLFFELAHVERAAVEDAALVTRSTAARHAFRWLDGVCSGLRGLALIAAGEARAREWIEGDFRRALANLAAVDVRGSSNQPRNELDASPTVGDPTVEDASADQRRAVEREDGARLSSPGP